MTGLLYLYFLLAIPIFSEAQSVNFENYVVTQYGLEEGLPQSSVNDIIQTQDGYIWLATYGGVVRFDGVSFTTFNRSNTPGMRSDRVIALFEQDDGTLWVSTEDGLLRYSEGQFTTFLIYVGSQVYAPSVMKEDASGKFWIVAKGRVFRFEKGRFTEIPVSVNPELVQEAVSDTSGVWLAFEKEILRTVGDSVVQFVDLGAELESNIFDFIEYPKHSGTYFLGTDGNGVIKYKNGSMTHYNVEEGLASRYIWGFDVDKSNTLWVTSYNGQTQWNGQEFVPFNAIDASEDIQFTGVFEDSEDNFWIGTTGQGLFKVRQSIISTIDKDQGLFNEKMLSLSRLRRGNILFATNCGGIYEWDGEKAIPAPINKYLPNQCVWTIYEDSKGYIWYGAKVLYRSTSINKPGVMYGDFNGFDGFDVFAITEDSEGNVWFGCFNGVFIYDGKTFTRYTTEDGLAYNDTRAFFEDENGKMWIGTSAGLSTMYKGNIKQVKLLTEETASKNSPEPYVRAIHKDADGVMWFGTYGNGIYRLKDGIVSNITKEDGLFDDIVSHIVEDDQGNFWMGSNRGISRVSRHEINEFLDGKIEEIHSYSYGTGDGMNSAETNGGFQPNVLSDDSGNLFFPTISGVSVVATKEVQKNLISPKVHIENLRSGKDQIPVASEISLPHDNPFLEIDYTALSFREPSKILFHYKMEGLDENWFDAGDRRIAMYTKIPPGDYTFKVIASNNDGIWNTEGASLNITVVPPFWETTWFYSLISLMIIALGTSVYYLRINQLKKENEQQKLFTEKLIQSQENERKRIASELHDGLGQQILVIKNRAELAKKKIGNTEEMSVELDEITQSAVSSIGDVRNISYALRPVHLEKFGLTEALINLCDEIKQTSSIEWSYHIDDIDRIIPNAKEINFYRIIQEGINNIMKHSGAGEASVMVSKSPSLIKVRIWDDGNGFEMETVEKSNGLGFLGMKERVQTLGGKLTVTSQKEKGTSLTITIPVIDHE